MLRAFTSTDHEGHWVGVASVVVAENAAAARDLLIQALADEGLRANHAFTLQELDLETPKAVVLQNGDY